MAAANTKAVRRALYAKLTGAGSITALVSTRVYHSVAPATAAYPLIVFFKQAGTPRYAMGATAFDAQVWTVKAIARDSTSDTAEDVANAVDALLTNGTLTLSTGELMDLRRTSDIDYIEEEDGQTFRHHGALYRVTVQ